ncbi:MAG: hypothetical protein E3J72_16775 [Planctomycetota bacterium]|nr:MAG: hypothetical protein E3J72_16775 [Planctomycetota bacterium]
MLSFNYTWTVDGDATSAQLEAMKSNIDRLNESLFSMGHGQQYIQSVTLRDNANDGDIRTPVDRVEASTLGGGSYAYTTGSGSGGIYIVCGGLVDRVTFGHEHGHKEHFLAGNNPSMMSVGEEYNCNACVMAIGGTRQYCDSTNHSTQYSFEPCWAGVMSNHPGMNHIEGDYSAPSGSCPAAQITVNDN